MSELCTLQGCFSGRINGSPYCGPHQDYSKQFQQHKEKKPSDCCNKECRGKALHGKMFCEACTQRITQAIPTSKPAPVPPVAVSINTDNMRINTAEFHDRRASDGKMSFKYPKYYKEIPSGVTELDIYLVCHIFQVQDFSGALHHAIKKILLPGVRTGGKSRRDDIKEARDTLTRWLEMNK